MRPASSRRTAIGKRLIDARADSDLASAIDDLAGRSR
jgi:hypothetical protein